MERKDKNSITTILFIVGGLFIAVAAVLFATTAWNSFSQGAKDITIFLAAVIGFAASYLVRQREQLQETATVLYYLATIFSGLAVYVLFAHYLMLSSLVEGDLYSNSSYSVPVFMAHLSMTIAIGVRLLRDRRALDIILLVVLVDMSYFWGVYNFISDFSCFPIVLSLFGLIQLFYTLAIVKEEAWNTESDKNVHTTAWSCYLLHIGVYGLMLLLSWSMASIEALSFLRIYNMKSYIEIGQTLGFLINAAMLLLIMSLLYRKVCLPVIRIFQSASMLLFVPAIVLPLKLAVEWCTRTEIEGGVICFVCYVLCCCVLFAFPRIEMLVCTASYAALAGVLQVMQFEFDMHVLGREGGVLEPVYPYQSLFLIAYVLVLLRCYRRDTLQLSSLLLEDRQGELDYREMLDRRLKNCIWYAGIIISVLFYYCTGQSMLFGVSSFIATALCFAAFQTKEGEGRSVMLTIAVFFTLIALFSQTIIAVPEELRVEWCILVLSLGVIAVCHIFKEKKEMKVAQFICISCLIGMQLIWNLGFGEQLNALILGAVGIGILLYGVFFNYKNYVLLAAVTLICLVVYLTKDFWLSISWWVYLLVAGIGLVALAIKKEREG